jgi:hypothetical protein
MLEFPARFKPLDALWKGRNAESGEQVSETIYCHILSFTHPTYVGECLLSLRVDKGKASPASLG